jgi:hypothetical protein
MGTFSIDNDATRDARKTELDKAKELYKWYQQYLYPIPTLFNAMLGDKEQGDGSANTKRSRAILPAPLITSA